MARLVIDTNCLLQCISRRSIYHDLWVSLLDGRNTLCVSTEILEEYTELFQKFTSAEFTEAALGVITNNIHTEFITPYYHFNSLVSTKKYYYEKNLFIFRDGSYCNDELNYFCM